jgi:FkbM family methyltransferase
MRTIHRDYSQSKETIAVREILGNRGARGVFVEVGANDGMTISTTLGLLKDGWSGWSIEANPVVYQSLVKNLQRFPKAKPVNVAMSPVRGKVKLFLGKTDPGGFYSTISTDDSQWFREHRGNSFVEVDGWPLSDFLAGHQVPARFDLLLVDTEGMDLEILQTLDVTRHKPALIITEDYEPKNPAKFQLLQSYGYKLNRQVGCNTFWVGGEKGAH